jgi:enterobacterial common antigen flippase
MIAVALVSLGCSYWFAQRVVVASVAVNWAETLHGFRRLLGLGLAFMWGGVMGACLDMLIRSVIMRKFGVEAVGIYQAAWSLSGVFASFVLSAMGADFYPRLTAVVHDKALAATEVNEQTEIGVLVALPGLLASIAFAPIAIRLLYTPQFIQAADLLPWMALGVFGQVVSWPLGYVQVAKGAARTFAATETIFAGVQALLTIGMVARYGLIGAAYAVTANYVLYILAMLSVTHILIDFSWSLETRKLILGSVFLMVATFLARSFFSDFGGLISATALTLVGSLFSLRGLSRRLGEEHRLVKWLVIVPGGNYLLIGAQPTVTPRG